MTKTVILQSLISPKLQKAIRNAAIATQKEINKHIETHTNWRRLVPREEKAAQIRGTLYSNLVESIGAVEPDRISIFPISSRKGSKVGNVNIIVVGNIGFHVISDLRDECPTLKSFRVKQKSPTLPGMGEDSNLHKDLQIFECIYKKKKNEIVAIEIMDRYDADCESLIFEISDSSLQEAEVSQIKAPKIRFKSPRKKSAGDGKDVAQ